MAFMRLVAVVIIALCSCAAEAASAAARVHVPQLEEHGEDRAEEPRGIITGHVLDPRVIPLIREYHIPPLALVGESADQEWFHMFKQASRMLDSLGDMISQHGLEGNEGAIKGCRSAYEKVRELLGIRQTSGIRDPQNFGSGELRGRSTVSYSVASRIVMSSVIWFHFHDQRGNVNFYQRLKASPAFDSRWYRSNSIWFAESRDATLTSMAEFSRYLIERDVYDYDPRPMDDRHQSALSKYTSEMTFTGHTYLEINTGLQEYDFGPSLLRSIIDLDEAVGRIRPTSQISYRVSQDLPPIYKEFVIRGPRGNTRGQLYMETEFMSSTTKNMANPQTYKYQAAGMAWCAQHNSCNWIIVLHHFSGRDVSRSSTRPEEREILFRPGVIWRQGDVFQGPSTAASHIRVIHLHEIRMNLIGEELPQPRK